jgi:hypothetical protein
MSGLLRSSGGGGEGGFALSLHWEAGGAGLPWGWRTGNGGQPHTGGCSNVGITYTLLCIHTQNGSGKFKLIQN